nr:unnamed protein product [Digitaria exilis]
MLRARGAARALLRLAGAGAGVQSGGGVPPLARAAFARGFLDFGKTGNKEELEKEKARLKDEMSRGYFADISEIRKNAGKIATASKVIIPEVDAVKFPDLAVESSQGGALHLPLVAPAPQEDGGKKMAESWSSRFLDAFGADKKIHVYEVSFVDSWLLSSSPVRRAVLKLMRKSDNPQRHVVYAFGDNYDFRKKLQIINLLTG